MTPNNADADLRWENKLRTLLQTEVPHPWPELATPVRPLAPSAPRIHRGVSIAIALMLILGLFRLLTPAADTAPSPRPEILPFERGTAEVK